jgi:hypothetical protein
VVFLLNVKEVDVVLVRKAQEDKKKNCLHSITAIITLLYRVDGGSTPLASSDGCLCLLESSKEGKVKQSYCSNCCSVGWRKMSGRELV